VRFMAFKNTSLRYSAVHPERPKTSPIAIANPLPWGSLLYGMAFQTPVLKLGIDLLFRRKQRTLYLMTNSQLEASCFFKAIKVF
jgi:hypothetical protein